MIHVKPMMISLEPVTQKMNVQIAKEPPLVAALRVMEFAAFLLLDVIQIRTKIAPISNPLECPKALAMPKFAPVPTTFVN